MPAFVALAALALAQQQPSRIGVHPPRLVVLISVDQFRADYIERFNSYFLPAKSGATVGGFRYLMETGANFRNAMHNHIPTATGPGHATLLTGSEPAFDGIVNNDWYDRAAGKSTYCVFDPKIQTVGGTSDPESPRNLAVTTVGDELKMATNGRSKVVGVAIKDRAAILLAGHAADTVVWLDYGTGNWVTSTWYAPDNRLPGWVQDLNKDRAIDKFAGQTWEPLLPDDTYAISRLAPFDKPSPTGKPFSHTLDTKLGKPFYTQMITSRYGNELTFSVAEKAIDAEGLGRHDVPDMLVINLSTNDYVGHRYGPNSPEVMDITVRTDRLLSEFLNKLQKSVPGGLDSVAFVLTGDHGVVPFPEESNGVYKTGAIRGFGDTVVEKIKGALVEKFGAGDWVLGDGLYEQNVYLNRQLATEKGLKMADVESTAAEAASSVPGIFAAYTRTQILANQVPEYPWHDRLLNGFNAQRGGDLMVLEAPGNYSEGGTETGHGTIWDYDAHVPILLHAAGVKPGIYLKPVHTSDIASTLCQLLGIEYPTGNVGHPLVESLGKR